MTYFTDEVARILAGPMPRRRALKLLSGVLAGAFLSSIGVQRAKAGSGCASCTVRQLCCNNACINSEYYQCCNGEACSTKAVCCSVQNPNTNSYCMGVPSQCSGSIIS